MKRATPWMGLGLLLMATSTGTLAQSVTLQSARTGPLPTQAQRADRAELSESKAFYLRNATSQADQNEILTALRNMVSPMDKIFLVPSRRAIIMRGDPDDLALAGRLIEEMDKPSQSYRLTYTFAEKEGGRTLGQQHFSMEMTPGQRTQAKGGNRLPIAVGPSPSADTGTASQVTYVDVGLSVDATGDEIVNGLRLRNKIERSIVAEERASASVGGDPVIRQSLLEGTITVPFGKPVMVGALDVPGSTRTVEISVTAEPVK